MRIVATSDLHGDLPNINPCDLLIVAGDVCPINGPWALRAHEPGAQRNWVRDKFIPWTEEQPAKRVVWIGGNHDFGVEMPGARRAFDEISPKWVHFLQDEAIEFMDNTIWGCPWCPNLKTWAYYASDRAWEAIAEDIPTDIDILVLHSPPRALKTIALCGGHPEWASPHIYNAIVNRIKPKLVVFGHLHEGYGWMTIGDASNGLDKPGITFANVARMNDEYEPVNEPMEFTLDE